MPSVFTWLLHAGIPSWSIEVKKAGILGAPLHTVLKSVDLAEGFCYACWGPPRLTMLSLHPPPASALNISLAEMEEVPDQARFAWSLAAHWQRDMYPIKLARCADGWWPLQPVLTHARCLNLSSACKLEQQLFSNQGHCLEDAVWGLLCPHKTLPTRKPE